jgi:hypothetical protein
MSNDEPIKIVIPVEEDPPHRPQVGSKTTKEQAGRVSRRLAATAGAAAKKAWDSDVRHKATDKFNEGFNAAATKGSEYLRDRIAATAEQQTKDAAGAVQTRIKEADWKREARVGLKVGLAWLGARLTGIAERLPADESPKDKSPTVNGQADG